MMLKFSAWLACVTGVILAVAAIGLGQGALPADEAFHDLYYVVVRPGAWITVLAAIFLLAAGTATLRGLKPGGAILAWAWGFAIVALLALAPPDWYLFVMLDGPKATEFFKTFLLGTALLTVTAILGLITAILGRRRGNAAR